MEIFILQTIDYRVNFPSIYELSMCAFKFVKFGE